MKYLSVLLLLLLSLTASAQLFEVAKDTTETSEDIVHSTAGLDKQPEYPGGQNAFYKYVQKNLRVPDVGQDLSLKLFVSFVIEKDGTISNIIVPRDPGYGLKQEVIRLLSSVKEKWSPGMSKGVPVRVKYSLPINIVYTAPTPPKEIEQE